MRASSSLPMAESCLLRMLSIAFVFCVATAIASPAQFLTTMHSFAGPPSDGASPVAGLVQGTDGNFYGTTFTGGANTTGTVFKITPEGTSTILYSFCSHVNQGHCLDGDQPRSALVQGTDGNFYGTTFVGGFYNGFSCAEGCGTVFKITPAGILTTLYSFCTQSGCPDGYGPLSGLVQATDGNFYGATYYGGANCLSTGGCGTIFRITPAGILTTLYSFCPQSGCPDGFNPAGMVQAADGNFYGTTYEGGTSYGTVFKITLAGTLTTLHRFDSTEGAYPTGLVQASDGNLYGTTYEGGTNGAANGTVYKITTGGTFTLLYSFCAQSDCTDGRNPEPNLLQATDGNLYGTTFSGGANNRGTIFRMNTAGMLTTLYSFCAQSGCPDGSQPYAGLVQGTSGLLYGTTSLGGTDNLGTVFSFSASLGSNPGQFVPVTPCRIVDTRNSNGPFGGPPITGGTSRSFALPQGGCNLPPNAMAYSLNVTVVPHGPLGYLTIWPAGQTQPATSLLNSLDGRIKANAAIVPAGVGGGVSVYVSNTSDVVLDVDGYFTAPGNSTLAFYPLPPCRVIDTRGNDGNLGGPFLAGQQQRNFPVLGSNCLASAQNAQAYSLNITVVPHPTGQPLGYLTVWPEGLSQPTVSTLNNLTATVVANAAIVPAGTNGAISVFASNDTDLVVDTNGYFAPAAQGALSLYTVSPCRVLDTRNNNGQPFMDELTVNVVGSPCAAPGSAQAYVFNGTVVPPGPLGYLTLWPDGGQQPIVSTLNALDGSVTSNMAIVPTANGSIDAFASNLTQLVLDISAYFAP